MITFSPDMVFEVSCLLFDSQFGRATGDFVRHTQRAAEGGEYSNKLVIQTTARAMLILAKVAEMTNQTYHFSIEPKATANDDTNVQNPA